jgi:rhodanese-related sulfurtransferase
MNRTLLLTIVIFLATAAGSFGETLTGQVIFNSREAGVMALKTPAGLAALAHGPAMRVTGIGSLDGLKPCDRVKVDAAPAGNSRVIEAVAFLKRDDGAGCALPDAPAAPLAEFERSVQERSALLVDVRTPGEFALLHFDGAVNIPLTEIESRRGELPKDRPVIIYCATSRRSSFAVLLLQEKGIATWVVKGKLAEKDGKPQILE